MIGFRSKKIPQWIKDLSAQYGLGGIILFDYDFQRKVYENNIESPEQLKDLCAEIHALPSRPLVFVDQEGGKVRRLKEKYGFQPLASAKAMAQMNIQDLEAQLAHSFMQMQACGIDVNLAPVLDLDSNPLNPDIGAVERSFSNDPETVDRYVDIVNRIGLHTRIGLTLKHYPGLGGAKVNSHLELTDISGTFSAEQLNLFYKWANRLWSPSVLLSHGVVREWEPDIPVSMSSVAIQRLRKQAPDALLMSDDIQMQGLQRLMNSPTAIQHGLLSGLDMIIVGNNMMPEDAYVLSWADQIAVRAQTDKKLQAALNSSTDRVLNFKNLFHPQQGVHYGNPSNLSH